MRITVENHEYVIKKLGAIEQNHIALAISPFLPTIPPLFAALAAKHNIDNPGYAHKSFYYIGGLTEGTETIVLFVLCCLFPAHFAVFAWIFGALCWLTTTTRVWSGYVTLKSLSP